jgi:hypothetical protein
MSIEAVSLERFIELLNKELARRREFPRGLVFVRVGEGYDLIDRSGALPPIELQPIARVVGDAIERKYSIAAGNRAA